MTLQLKIMRLVNYIIKLVKSKKHKNIIIKLL